MFQFTIRALLLWATTAMIVAPGCVNTSNGGGFLRVPEEVKSGTDFQVIRENLLLGYPIGDIDKRYEEERCFVRYGPDGKYEELPTKREKINSTKLNVVSTVPGERTLGIDEVWVYWTLKLDGVANGGEHEAKKVRVVP